MLVTKYSQFLTLCQYKASWLLFMGTSQHYTQLKSNTLYISEMNLDGD